MGQINLGLALEATGMVAWEWDIPTGTVRYSEQISSVVHGTAVAPFESLDTLLQRLHPDDRDRLAQALDQAAREGSPFECEYRVNMLDGTCRWILGIGKLVEVENGKPVRVQGFSRDITRRKEAEEKLRKLELQIQHAQKEESLEVLAGGIAHDFNNLLTIIEGTIALVSADLAADNSARQLLDDADRAARRAADLCQQLLAYVGRAALSFTPLQLNPLLRDTANLVASSLSKNAQLHWYLADRLPQVRADAKLVQQVFVNLLINASEAIGNQPGHITLTTGVQSCTSADLHYPWVKEPLAAGDYVFLEVTDSGCGIEPSLIDRLFDPFFSTKATGRGLGLAAALGIVRSHRGTIQVQSLVGRGSTLRVWLPALLADTTALQPAVVLTPDWRGTGTVLVVDDEEGIRFLAERMLRRLGFDALTAANGLEAIEIFRANPQRIWCVLLDLTMPWMGGEATFRELVHIDENVRVVMSSGYARDDIMERFGAHGPVAFLQKPYNQQRLSEVLQTLASKKGGG